MEIYFLKIDFIFSPSYVRWFLYHSIVVPIAECAIWQYATSAVAEALHAANDADSPADFVIAVGVAAGHHIAYPINPKD